jgi:hypothetical protein
MFSISLNTDYQKSGFTNSCGGSPEKHFSSSLRPDEKIKYGKNIGNKVVAFYFSENNDTPPSLLTEPFIEKYTTADGGELIIDKKNNISLYFKGRLYNYDELSKLIGVTDTEELSESKTSLPEFRDSPERSEGKLTVLAEAVSKPKMNYSECNVEKLIIILYKKFGFEYTLQLLNGHFSIVLLDNNLNNKNDELYIAVDPFASFPLFILETTNFPSQAPEKSFSSTFRPNEKNTFSEDVTETKSNLYGTQSRINEKCYEISTVCYSNKHIPIISGCHCSFRLSYKINSLWEKSYFNKKYFHIDTHSIYYDNIEQIKQMIKTLLISSFEYQYKYITSFYSLQSGEFSSTLCSDEKMNAHNDMVLDKNYIERFTKIQNSCNEFFGIECGKIVISILGINYLINDSSTNILEYDFQIREGLKNMGFYDVNQNDPSSEDVKLSSIPSLHSIPKIVFSERCADKYVIYPFLDKSFFQFYMSIHPSIRFLYKESIIVSSLAKQ